VTSRPAATERDVEHVLSTGDRERKAHFPRPRPTFDLPGGDARNECASNSALTGGGLTADPAIVGTATNDSRTAIIAGGAWIPKHDATTTDAPGRNCIVRRPAR
jgi:hypothetical protein